MGVGKAKPRPAPLEETELLAIIMPVSDDATAAVTLTDCDRGKDLLALLCCWCWRGTDNFGPTYDAGIVLTTCVRNARPLRVVVVAASGAV